jgi:hypothetical protein
LIQRALTHFRSVPRTLVSPLSTYLSDVHSQLLALRTVSFQTCSHAFHTSISSLISRAEKRSRYLSSAIAHHIEQRRSRHDHADEEDRNEDMVDAETNNRKKKKRRRSSWAGSGVPVPVRNLDCEAEVQAARAVGLAKDILVRWLMRLF